MIKEPLHVLQQLRQQGDYSGLFSEIELDVSIEQYSRGIEYYQEQLKKIGFEGMDNLLDAGCGPGQWSIAALNSNSKIYGIDPTEGYIEIAQTVASRCGFPRERICFQVGSVEKIGYPDNSFDGLFCYGVLMFTDYKAALGEFFRVLKPGGKLYILASDLGWYLYYFLGKGLFKLNFDQMRLGAGVIINTFRFRKKPFRATQKFFFIRASEIIKNLQTQGFEKISREVDIKDSYSRSRYLGMTAVYEILCSKPLR
ncbi:class I SAM-dependent methyltransferase [bacterium]|nr:class I SAM-dependent methyltransferase [bacterium]